MFSNSKCFKLESCFKFGITCSAVVRLVLTIPELFQIRILLEWLKQDWNTSRISAITILN